MDGARVGSVGRASPWARRASPCGRSAPHVASKANDPRLWRSTRRGALPFPLLSGHLGGANELAQTVARAAGGHPVITTATDVRGVGGGYRGRAVRGSPFRIPRPSSECRRGCSGGRVAPYSDMPISGQPPEGVDIASDRARADIVVSPFVGANAGASVRAAGTTGESCPPVRRGSQGRACRRRRLRRASSALIVSPHRYRA